jgi:uncharacterized repeat protein (TIGR01451 family)
VIAVDGAGNLYIGNQLTVQQVAAASGIVTTVAGNGQPGKSGDGGLAVNAELEGISGLAVDASGNIYIAGGIGTIRKVTAATGIITTIATTAGGLTVDSAGNIYVAGNNRILLLVPEGSRPVLSVTKTHTGSFTLGQAGATYSVVVSNAANAGATSDTVTLSEVIPNGLTLQSMSGTGWSCTANSTCTRSDTLSGGTSYPPITVAVSVGTDGPSQVTNQVTLTGGGQALATAATDAATIVANPSTAVVTTVSAASGAAPVTADSIVSLYGVNIYGGLHRVGGASGSLASRLGRRQRNHHG